VLPPPCPRSACPIHPREKSTTTAVLTSSRTQIVSRASTLVNRVVTLILTSLEGDLAGPLIMQKSIVAEKEQTLPLHILQNYSRIVGRSPRTHPRFPRPHLRCRQPLCRQLIALRYHRHQQCITIVTPSILQTKTASLAATLASPVVTRTWTSLEDDRAGLRTTPNSIAVEKEMMLW